MLSFSRESIPFPDNTWSQIHMSFDKLSSMLEKIELGDIQTDQTLVVEQPGQNSSPIPVTELSQNTK